MKNFIILALNFLSLSFIACSHFNNNDKYTSDMEKDLPKLVENPEQRNPDFYFRIISIEENDSSFYCQLKSLAGQDTVGIQLEILKWIEPGLTADGSMQESGFSTGKFKFIPFKNLSTNFVSALSKQYVISGDFKSRKGVLKPLTFSSNKSRITFENNKIYSFKLFFENTNGTIAEAFSIIDMHRRLFEIRAKDESFFFPLLTSFAE